MGWKMTVLFFGFTTTLRFISAKVLLNEMKDYAGHSCVRECKENTPPQVCEYDWTIELYWTMGKACFDCPFNVTDCTRPQCVAADGVSRAILTVNRMIPGPTIQVCKGDEIVVNVHNQMRNGEGTTIHWHGILQKGTQFMDGVNMVTQCPIPVGTAFQYRFKAEDAGTFFWHAHTGLQRCDGVFGSLVIRQPPSLESHYHLYDYDLPQHVVIVTDWLADLTNAKFAAHHYDDGNNKAESMLINGKGARANFTDQDNNTFTTPYAEFNVEPNKTYRFRVISAGIMNCPIQVSVDEHNMLMIASDGQNFDPVIVDSFNIFAGERFDFLLRADKPVDNYWFRATGLSDCSYFKVHQVAALRYAGAPSNETSAAPVDYEAGLRNGITLNPLNTPANSTQISLDLVNSTLPDNHSWKPVPDKRFYLAMDFMKVDNFHFDVPGLFPLNALALNKQLYSPQINFISFQTPPVPLLTQFQDLSEADFCNADTIHSSNCSQEYCECIHLLKVALGDEVELIFIDEGVIFNSSHPMHLHGFKFGVLGIGRLNTTTSLAEIMSLDKAGKLPRKLSRAIFKDTVIVPDGGYTIVRFKADNPGMWFMHCHIEFHAEIGMALVIQVGEANQMPTRPADFPTCNDWKFTGFQNAARETATSSTEKKPNSGRIPWIPTYYVLLTVIMSYMLQKLC